MADVDGDIFDQARPPPVDLDSLPDDMIAAVGGVDSADASHYFEISFPEPYGSEAEWVVSLHVPFDCTIAGMPVFSQTEGQPLLLDVALLFVAVYTQYER